MRTPAALELCGTRSHYTTKVLEQPILPGQALSPIGTGVGHSNHSPYGGVSRLYHESLYINFSLNSTVAMATLIHSLVLRPVTTWPIGLLSAYLTFLLAGFYWLPDHSYSVQLVPCSHSFPSHFCRTTGSCGIVLTASKIEGYFSSVQCPTYSY